MTSNPSSAWQKLQDVFYCLEPLYKKLNWNIETLYTNYNVKISTQSTLLALSSKFVKHPSIISIYSISGQEIWKLSYNANSGDYIFDYGFRDEDLCVVLSNKTYRYYYDFNGNFVQHGIMDDLVLLDNRGNWSFNVSSSKNGDKTIERPSVKTTLQTSNEETARIRETKIWGNFLVLRLGDSFIFTNLETHENFCLTLEGYDDSSMYYMNLLTVLKDSLIFLLSYEATILSIEIDFGVNSFSVVDYGLTEGPFSKFSASPKGTLIALFNSNVEKIFVITSKFDQVLLEYDTSNESSHPYQVEWCGNDAIVLSLRDELKLIGPNQKYISFFYDIVDDADLDLDSLLKNNAEDEFSFTIPILKTENDGLKVFSTKRIEFLRRVPKICIDLYQIGSNHPSAILLDCMDKVSLQSYKAETSISFLKSEDSLETAISCCVKASLDEFDSSWQKKLLRAASFGKAHCEKYFDSDMFLNSINTLRVLNQLRSQDVGIFLTYGEIISIGWRQVVFMLLRRMMHYLALEVIEILDIPNLQTEVYLHWCYYKIKNSLDLSDPQLYKIINDKLNNITAKGMMAATTLSTKKIVDVAFEEGRGDLCRLLINMDSSPTERIKMFLSIQEYELAIIAAFKSGDFQMSKLLLLELHDTLSPAKFLEIINQNKEIKLVRNSSDDVGDDVELHVAVDIILDFWLNNLSMDSVERRSKYFELENGNQGLVEWNLEKFLRESKREPMSGYFEGLKAKLESAINYSTSKRKRKSYELRLRILELQNKLSETYQTNFFREDSITDILHHLISLGQIKVASKISKEYKIPLEKFWFLVLDYYCKQQDFDRLLEFIKSYSSTTDGQNLRSPIGFKRIVECCLTYRAPPTHISIYINNCNDLTYMERYRLYLRNNDPKLAANLAFRSKDLNSLHSLLDLVTQSGPQNESNITTIKEYIARLT